MMKFTALVALAGFTGTKAFQLNSRVPHTPTRRSASATELNASVEDMAGVTSFPGFFDPLSLSAGKTPEDIKRWREAELKHGRVCMLAALGILVAENFNPLFGGNIEGPAIRHFQQIPGNFWLVLPALIFLAESKSISKGWASPFSNDLFSLKPEYQAGDLGFDPLGFAPEDEEEFKNLQTKELNNGRLAMLATAGLLVQELVNGLPIGETLNLKYGLFN
uniref:Plastid light harvesting protein n=1 Tax=Chromera velia CCMP2878 TaxID=1169474 RepID=A0A0G4GTJ0_9ALVE|mmetsp:Transcript_25694/g.50289  ORF Transcript_25694/g.50289 Transcript_25694/m.50289 type:complete len:220 (+) Transcript_25694:158-817(+)|eukprot:Cvel_5193.t1-p1 / transcript=Cvel_5193.t1 / gene=Cvel_5193 / organism=Chromera_velia_CCMP2878 / gene_product=Chlorophyll a-b binding protein L1818,, putative / transcript_product=Chlorophyll a-b binding protein L1818,, putative / location=Cvel_scaffold238:105540-106581(-) / protein_length=219 / sequence_SO=supercontig / SO=protein_coding / is_pseudo=false